MLIVSSQPMSLLHRWALKLPQVPWGLSREQPVYSGSLNISLTTDIISSGSAFVPLKYDRIYVE